MSSQDTSRAGMSEGDRGTSTSMGDGAAAGDGQTSGKMIDAARDKIHQLASQARETASDQFESRFSSGKSRAAGTLGSIAQSLHSSSQQLRDQEQGGIGNYAEQAAGKVEALSHYLENATLSDVATRVEDFARREPALFIGGALAFGFMSARFLKSSQRAQGDRSSALQTRAPFAQQGANPRGDGPANEPWMGGEDREVASPARRDWASGNDVADRNDMSERIGPV